MKNVPATSKKQEPHFLRSKSSAREKRLFGRPSFINRDIKKIACKARPCRQQHFLLPEKRFSSSSAASHQGRQPQQTQGRRGRFRNGKTPGCSNNFFRGRYARRNAHARYIVRVNKHSLIVLGCRQIGVGKIPTIIAWHSITLVINYFCSLCSV